MATSINNSAWLEWITGLMGGMSRQTHATTFPPDRYYCLLDELPLHLVPQAARKRLLREEKRPESVVLNPDCIFCAGDDVPAELRGRRDFLSGFAMQGTIAWVRDRATLNLLPFWLGPRFEKLVRNLRPHEIVSSAIPESDVAILAGAGILISKDDSPRPGGAIANSNDQFREKGYALLPQLIHPFHVAALRRYFRYRIRSGAIPLGDRQSARRYAVHNEPVARFFHHQIASVLSDVAGEALKPSYVYFASYMGGAELKKHTDREQCDFSITFCLDYSPEPDFATSWPIRLETRTGISTVYQTLGDGLAYRGTQVPHFRDVLPDGQTSTSIFFHYVKADFAGSLE
jgi:hypothetical protein